MLDFDRSEFLGGYAFSDERLGAEISAEAARERLREAAVHSSDFVWLHFNLANAAAERYLREHFALPDAFFATIHEPSPSTRIEQEDDWLTAVLNDVLYDFEHDATHVSTLWVALSARLLITVRRKPLRSIDRLRTAVRTGERFTSTVELLTRLFSMQAHVLLQITRGAAARVDSIEDALLAERARRERDELGALRRVLVRLSRVLAPEPAALFRLLNRPPAWITPIDSRELRQATEEFAAVLHDLEALLERMKLVQEEIGARVAEENNRSLFLLTVLTVLALPVNVMTGFFGMNVGGVPLAQHPGGFWIVFSIATVFTVAAVVLVIWRRRD